MLAIVVITVLCTAGVAFYVRFLGALGNECSPRLIAYWNAAGTRNPRERHD
jgi:hypothetical protein